MKVRCSLCAFCSSISFADLSLKIRTRSLRNHSLDIVCFRGVGVNQTRRVDLIDAGVEKDRDGKQREVIIRISDIAR